MTGPQNIEFGLQVRRRPGPARRAKVAELLELVGLSDAGSRYAYQLSGGQQQRIALARALAIEPSILLLDEPLSALDAKVPVSLCEEVRRIQREFGTTTLYVTHDQEEALSISDRVAVMAGGRLEQVGTPAEVYSAPTSTFVAEFVGTVNRIWCTVVDADTGIVEHQGQRLSIDDARGMALGRVTLLVRPEALVVSPLHAVGSPGALIGRVVGTSFLRAVTRLWVDVTAGSVLGVDLPSTSAGPYRPGTDVALRITPKSGRMMDRGSVARGDPSDGGEGISEDRRTVWTVSSEPG